MAGTPIVSPNLFQLSVMDGSDSFNLSHLNGFGKEPDLLENITFQRVTLNTLELMKFIVKACAKY